VYTGDEPAWRAATLGEIWAEPLEARPTSGGGRGFVIGEAVGALVVRIALPDDFWFRRPPDTNFMDGDFAFLD
jgi:hypothetical protein